MDPVILMNSIVLNIYVILPYKIAFIIQAVSIFPLFLIDSSLNFQIIGARVLPDHAQCMSTCFLNQSPHLDTCTFIFHNFNTGKISTLW